MRQQIGLFIIGLICLSTIAATSSDSKYLQGLKKSEFGKTLVESIQIELRSASGQDAVDRIVKLLNEIKVQIVKEGKSDAIAFKKHSDELTRQINEKSSRIAGLVKDLAEDRNLIKLNVANIAAAQKELDTQSKQLAQQERLLAANNETQIRETEQYKAQFTALSNQITALASARQLLQNFLKGSFVQIDQQSFIQVSSTLNNIQFSHPKFAGFVSILAEMLTSSERIHGQAQFKSIVALIDRLYDQLVRESQHLTLVFKRRIADLQLVQQRIQYTIEEHTQQIARLEQRIAQLRSQNVQASQRIANNEQRKTETENEKKDLERTLADDRSAFNGRVTKRAEEVTILDRVHSIFNTRLTEEVRSSVNGM